MDFFLKLFDLFNNTAKNLAAYVPQNGSDLIQLFQKLFAFSMSFNGWIADNIGVNLQAALAPLGKLVFTGANFLLELVKTIIAKL